MAHNFRNSGVLFARDLCKAIDLDPNKYPVRSVVLRSAINEIATVTVEMLVSVDQEERVSAVLKRYALTELTEKQV